MPPLSSPRILQTYFNAKLTVLPRRTFWTPAISQQHSNSPLTLETLGTSSSFPKHRKPPPNPQPTKLPIDTAGALFSATSFQTLSLPPPLLQRLQDEGFNSPTDIQSAAIPQILSDKDVIIQSYTGSGKTLAYLLPILSQIGPLSPSPPSKDISAVIVAPSRELAMQIVREFQKLLGEENKRTVQQLVGGANKSRQEEALKKNKPNIVVGTPGRIAEISAAGKLHTHFCKFLVLDEVDELLSFNFREDIHRILDHVGKKANNRQLILVSASVPFSVIRAAQSWGRDPLVIKASSSSSSSPQESVMVPPTVKHYYCVSKLQHKVDAVRRCVHALEAKRVMVFVNNAKQAKDVVHKMEARGIIAGEMSGEMGKMGREAVMRGFKKGEIRVLVTSEVAARGLDVEECDLVVNVGLPTDGVHYAHRAGRTGRLGRAGAVVSVCEEGEVFVVEKMGKQLGVRISGCDFVEGKLLLVDRQN